MEYVMHILLHRVFAGILQVIISNGMVLPRFESLALLGGHIPKKIEFGPQRLSDSWVEIQTGRLAFIRVMFVLRGNAQCLARIDYVR